MKALSAWLILVALPAAAAAQDRFFDSNGVQIRYIDQGSGEPVVLIHGLLGNIEWSWGDIGIIANLSKDHRVIASTSADRGRAGSPTTPMRMANRCVWTSCGWWTI